MLARNVSFLPQRMVCIRLYELWGLINAEFPFWYQNVFLLFRSDSRIFPENVHLFGLPACFQLQYPSICGIAIEALKALDPVRLKNSIAFFLNLRYPYGRSSGNTPLWFCTTTYHFGVPMAFPL